MLTLTKSSKAEEQEEGKVANSSSNPIDYEEMGQGGSLQPSSPTYSLMHPNLSSLAHSKDIASVDGDRKYIR